MIEIKLSRLTIKTDALTEDYFTRTAEEMCLKEEIVIEAAIKNLFMAKFTEIPFCEVPVLADCCFRLADFYCVPADSVISLAMIMHQHDEDVLDAVLCVKTETIN